MLQAWITSPVGSIYFAAEATPYNLQCLRVHVRTLRRSGAEQVCVTVNLGGERDGGAVPEVSGFLQQLAAEGVRVRFSAAMEECAAPLGTPVGRAAAPRAGPARRSYRSAR